MMLRLLAETIIAAAAYGFAIGSVHSGQYAVQNLAKFPLIILLTGGVCSIAYYLFSQFVSRKLRFEDVQLLALRTSHDVSLLLASLSTVSFFLARTLVQPDEWSLNEYPFFVGMNVVFIAVCGTVALVRRALSLVREHSLVWGRGVTIVLLWLALSLFVGGQWAWYLRPFFGVSTIRGDPFIMGTMPDFRGATSFYEAVYYLVKPPNRHRGPGALNLRPRDGHDLSYLDRRSLLTSPPTRRAQ